MRMRTVVAALAGAGIIGLPIPGLAHVEYYDLNQGHRIADLTAAGKVKSTEQYGSTPAAALALSGSTANGVGVLSSQSDLPLNNTAYWNSTYQVYNDSGTFSNVSYDAATGFGTAKVVVDDVTDSGWGAGTQSTLGDSHSVDFFNFRLTTSAVVTISWNVDTDGTYIDSAFSIYKGVLTYNGHDDSVDKLNPKTGITTKVQNALDAQNAPADVQGITSDYRNTTGSGPGNYIGQFDALGNWGQANAAGNWSNVEFIAYANANNPAEGFSTDASDTLETLTIVLGPGNYTIAASGALGAALSAGGTGTDSFGLSGLRGELTFSAVAAPVPEPSNWALLLGGLGLTALAARRRATWQRA
ncbi:PEP-CTERM sorting domain-containing protein [Methyloversatilis thermotolerans]|uniref:PEP-CTERM sorting domain-containing protein n=1 Tax=Methyloversatilis thermotolerans TaxID=1346290 RepID=UPI0003720DE5|nr:PEP-CTERM sorting domain-containing protein [Methyloversatilis thermotolerans]